MNERNVERISHLRKSWFQVACNTSLTSSEGAVCQQTRNSVIPRVDIVKTSVICQANNDSSRVGGD